MSVTITIPDLIPACRALLRGQGVRVPPAVIPYVTELNSVYITLPGWIDTFIPDPAQLPRNAVKISAAGGTGSFGRAAGLRVGRVQFDCYGRTAKEAAAIAFLVSMILLPMERRQVGFVAENTLVTNIIAITGPLPGIDPDVKSAVAPIRTLSADMEYAELAVAA